MRPPAKLTLASSSPQRRELLELLGVGFEVRPADVEELSEGEAHAVAHENALRKARSVDGELVLAADTLVALDGRIFGKPADLAAARETLRALSGRRHEVVSGLVLLSEGRERRATVSTQVLFRTLDDPLIEWYLSCGEWRGRAGGYAIQGRGAALVERIEGDYTNVVGLPIAALLELAPELLCSTF